MTLTPCRILLVAGARPNFMKVGPILREMELRSPHFQARLIHTGQHYDPALSEVFFEELNLPCPHRHLGVGSGSHAQQTAAVMLAFEEVCLQEQPQLVVVVGDVNSTIACALTAKKLGISVAHVEAGLRSRDWTMPEEINRVVTDRISDFLFTPSRDADENLLQEGVAAERIFFVGNVMIDTLLECLPRTDARSTLHELGLEKQRYATLTLHRPGNVDDEETFRGILEAVLELAREMPVIWPVHPRSRKMLERSGLVRKVEVHAGLRLIQPLGYLDMLTLNRFARLILTDSGGLQEEATVLRIPCLTLRENTERPVTVQAGANRVVGQQPQAIRRAISEALDRNGADIRVPEYWDGRAAKRIVSTLYEKYFPAARAETAETALLSPSP